MWETNHPFKRDLVSRAFTMAVFHCYKYVRRRHVLYAPSSIASACHSNAGARSDERAVPMLKKSSFRAKVSAWRDVPLYFAMLPGLLLCAKALLIHHAAHNGQASTIVHLVPALSAQFPPMLWIHNLYHRLLCCGTLKLGSN